eukprot:GHVS01096430.1.p2 GENE.GHVS01096430.1~~GHVS01096430.1.p2  ORF type:complete len:114 (+),score=19.44 GHVS01096430.1:2-343(+)
MVGQRFNTRHTWDSFPEYQGIEAPQQYSAGGGANVSSGSTCRQVLSRGYYECTQSTSRQSDGYSGEGDGGGKGRENGTESIDGISTGASSDIDPSSSTADSYSCSYVLEQDKT